MARGAPDYSRGAADLPRACQGRKADHHGGGFRGGNAYSADGGREGLTPSGLILQMLAAPRLCGEAAFWRCILSSPEAPEATMGCYDAHEARMHHQSAAIVNGTQPDGIADSESEVVVKPLGR